MNWNRLIQYSSVALALVAVPAATAQNKGQSRVSARPSFAASASKPMGAASSRGIGSSNSRRSGNWNNGSGRSNWRTGDRGRWGHRGHGHGHHHHGHFYPNYGYYPFGFGYGYGFGYPYFGSSLYYNGYNNGYYSQRAGNGGSVVVNVQQELARAGYYRGAIDGVAGDGTRRAIRAYERANGLPVDGRIDSELLSNMGLG